MAETPPPDRRSSPPGVGWSQPTFTTQIRAPGPGPLPFSRPEERRLHQESIAFALVRAISRVPVVRRLAGAVPPSLGTTDRAAQAGDPDALLATPLYRRLDRLRSSGVYHRLWREGLRPLVRGRVSELDVGASAPAPGRPPVWSGVPAAPAAPLRLGRWLSHRVGEAIDLLKSVPFEEIQRRGWHFQPNHFYWPLNDVAFLRDNRDLWHDRGLPAGVDWDLDAQIAHARAASAYMRELDDVPEHLHGRTVQFAWDNQAFSAADAIVYYGLVRRLEPRRVIEVGSGWSSLLLARALARNERPCEVALVEPFPNEWLFDALPPDWEVHRSILQHADLRLFERLEPGDICFFDGSHCVRTAGDVNWFLFEVLPRLSPGVFVQIHDIFFPDDYHDTWIFDEGLSWNEQYPVQAFLMYNDAYRVHIANHALWRERRAEIDDLHGQDGGSLWLEKIG